MGSLNFNFTLKCIICMIIGKNRHFQPIKSHFIWRMTLVISGLWYILTLFHCKYNLFLSSEYCDFGTVDFGILWNWYLGTLVSCYSGIVCLWFNYDVPMVNYSFLLLLYILTMVYIDLSLVYCDFGNFHFWILCIGILWLWYIVAFHYCIQLYPYVHV